MGLGPIQGERKKVMEEVSPESNGEGDSWPATADYGGSKAAKSDRINRGMVGFRERREGFGWLFFVTVAGRLP